MKKNIFTGWLLFVDILYVMMGMMRMVFNSKDISPIFKGRSFVRHKSFRLAMATMYANPEVNQLIQERYLAPAPADLDELAKLPEGTLGQVFAAHMRHHNLKVVFYPPLEYTADDDISYMRMRARQTHDIHHVVLGFPAVEVGEMAISAFYLAQHRVPLSGLLLGTGFFVATLRDPHRLEDLMNAIITGWQMGKKAKAVLGVRWEEYWSHPIAEVRQMLNITPPPAQLFEPSPNPLAAEVPAVVISHQEA